MNDIAFFFRHNKCKVTKYGRSIEGSSQSLEQSDGFFQYVNDDEIEIMLKKSIDDLVDNP